MLCSVCVKPAQECWSSYCWQERAALPNSAPKVCCSACPAFPQRARAPGMAGRGARTGSIQAVMMTGERGEPAAPQGCPAAPCLGGQGSGWQLCGASLGCPCRWLGLRDRWWQGTLLWLLWVGECRYHLAQPVSLSSHWDAPMETQWSVPSHWRVLAAEPASPGHRWAVWALLL